MQARHFPDRTRTNNQLTNLSWATPEVNQGDRVLHGTTYRGDTRGEKSGGSKLTEREVLKIRERLARGETQTSIAEKYGVTQTTISFIALRQTWKHI
jgi:DNA-binding NarL/FixJ family response regulator